MKNTFLCNANGPIVNTKYGKLRGFLFNDVYNFWGVRYAVARRFEEPREQLPWAGIKDALAYGYISPKLGNPLPDNELTVPHRYWIQGEDCLNLNVATPTIDPSAKKPVMVWFHGGGYSDGSAIEHIAFEGDNMARYHDVVMVVVNHRLNVFGFLDLSDFGEKYKNSGNAGIADLVAALKWVKENIEAFGGDPDNVTIFGQSGGGGKVNTLGQTPAADGLFQKAIVMSGVFKKGTVKGYPEVSHREFTEYMLDSLGLAKDDIEGLKKVSLPVFTLIANRAVAHFGKEGRTVNWGPHKNDWYLGDPLENGFRNHFKQIPTIIGTTLGEFLYPELDKNIVEMSEDEQRKLVADKYGEEYADKVISLFKKAYPGKAIGFAYLSDSMVRLGSVEYAKLKSIGEHAPVYSYILSAVYDLSAGMTAWHNCDIPYAFANAERIPYCCSTPNWEQLSFAIPAAFSAFAHTGNPDVDGLPHWSCATSSAVPTMIYDDVIEVKTGHDTEFTEYISSIEKPVEFSWRMPKDDEDEEEKHAWRY